MQANTKYVSGGADVINGAILTNREDLIARMKETIADLGVNVAPDDAYLVLRGLRTAGDAHGRSTRLPALEVARWLKQRPEVLRVLHPALEDDPGHALWKRDFSGASGLFGFVLRPAPTKQVHVFLDALELFGLGFSYGGFESLAIHCDPQLKRTATRRGLRRPADPAEHRARGSGRPDRRSRAGLRPRLRTLKAETPRTRRCEASCPPSPLNADQCS